MKRLSFFAFMVTALLLLITANFPVTPDPGGPQYNNLTVAPDYIYMTGITSPMGDLSITGLSGLQTRPMKMLLQDMEICQSNEVRLTVVGRVFELSHYINTFKIHQMPECNYYCSDKFA